MLSCSRFIKIINEFYASHKRKFIWRDVDNPYYIFVSEVMLQQTQTARVEQKFDLFVNELPGFESLATAPFSFVLALWKGLGYNRRAKYLQESAQKVVNAYGGNLPVDPEILQTFPGIGPNTACSISTFAFNKPHVFIETNIRTVFLHHFFPQEEKVSDKKLFPLIEKTLDKKDPRQWYYALMDYGVYLKKLHKNPSRRSKHHVIQSKFEGSNRQIRGQILEQLLHHGSLVHEEFYDLLMFDPQRIDAMLQQLAEEKLIVNKDNQFIL